jgi:hypothetical protein
MIPPTNDEVNELARRLAAAFASAVVKHRSVDRVLSETRGEPGKFWIDLARVLLDALSLEKDDLVSPEVLNKHVQ